MKKIAIIFHSNDEKRTHLYAITYLANFWKQEGIEVNFIYGPEHFRYADIAILHIDLSIVPDNYLAFAKKYPYTLNRKVRDIRKSTFSKHILLLDNKYEGKVIIKSNLNYAGLPERIFTNQERNLTCSVIQKRISELKKKVLYSRFLRNDYEIQFNSPNDYIILDSPEFVPKQWYKREDIVIEQFLPEFDGEHYCVRNYFFLGDQSVCILRKSTHPIVNQSSTVSIETVQVHREIEALRRKLNFDYGKFDYVVHNNIPILLDVNKTTGAPASPYNPIYLDQRRKFG